MKLITKEVESLLLANPLYSTDGKRTAPVLVKFFFGLVDLGTPEFVELGYFTLSELTSVVKFGKPTIERDKFYSGGYGVDKSERTVMKLATN
jgi:hypothetical protein